MDANATEIMLRMLDMIKEAMIEGRTVTIKATDVTIKAGELIMNDPEITVE